MTALHQRSTPAPAQPSLRFAAEALCGFAIDCLTARGLAPELAQKVAEILVEGDLMGHDTHGLALLPAYLAALESGGMRANGQPKVIADRPAAAVWDGDFLPGPWLLSEGFRLGIERARESGTFTLSIARSHHTASLAAYLRPVVEAGMIGMIAVSDPTESCVLPFGGTAPLLSTNPLAWGFPGQKQPVLVDISTSMTTNGMVKRRAAAGELFSEACLADAHGQPSRDPAVRFGNPPGSILPLGGMSSGHKGTALGIVAEALTHGLSGNGRGPRPKGWQSNVLLQVLDPEAFGGLGAFGAELDHLAGAIRANPPADPARPTRVPGDQALARRAERLIAGVPLAASILNGLDDCARALSLPLPLPIDEISL